MTMLELFTKVTLRHLTAEEFSLLFCSRIGGCEKCPLIKVANCYEVIEEKITEEIPELGISNI